MNSNKIIKYLLGETYTIDSSIPEYDITTVSDLSTPCKNSLLFCRYGNYEEMINLEVVKESIICVPNTSIGHNAYTLGDNVIIGTDDPRFRFGKCIIEFNIRKIAQEVEFTPYHQICKSSKVISKSAKVYNTICGPGCSFHHNVLVGVDDFTPMRSPDNTETILLPQLGYVILGKNVEIFNNSIVSRGALFTTEIGDDTKIDSLVQVGHNCKIGKNCMITAGVIIAGGVHMGDNVFVGVGSHIRNGVTIGSNVTIAQGSNVVKDIPDNAVVMGNPARIVEYNKDTHQATDVPC